MTIQCLRIIGNPLFKTRREDEWSFKQRQACFCISKTAPLRGVFPLAKVTGYFSDRSQG